MTLRASVEGNLAGLLAGLPDPQQVSRGINRRWAQDAQARGQEKYGGGPGTRYLVSRTGGTRGTVRGTPTPDGAELTVEGPGVLVQELGAVITPVAAKYLTFRLLLPTDTDSPTGAWVRTRRVVIPAKHPIRDSGDEATAHLALYLEEELDGTDHPL